MKKKKYKEFLKRYDKFQKNNLPTPFWDDERQTLEYVHFINEKEREISDDLVYALENITRAGLYYSYTTKYIVGWLENGELKQKEEIGHYHGHSFEEVVHSLYYAPQSFKITKEDEQFYSQQELDYLRKVQKYLLFIGLEDFKTGKIPIARYRNKKQKKYGNLPFYNVRDEVIKDILTGKRNFLFSKRFEGYNKCYSKGDKALLLDLEDNIKLYIEFTKIEEKLYSDIKDYCYQNEYQDNDKIIVRYFKILEIF